MHTNIVVDDELKTCQADPRIGQLAEVKCQLRVADIHHDLDPNLGHQTTLHLSDFGFQQAVVNETGVAFGAAHRHQHAFLEHIGGVATADHCRDAQFARDDGRMASPSAAVGNNRGSTLHHWLPIRIGHIRHQHIPELNLVHLADVVHDANRTGANLLSNGTPLHDHGALALDLVAVLHLASRLAFHRFGPCLQDVEFAINAIFAPLNIHRAAIVLLDHEGVMGQFFNLGIGQGIAIALLGRNIDGFHQFATGGLFFGSRESHLDQFGAQRAADDGAFAGLEHRLVNMKLVWIHGSLHHRFTQPIA